MFVITGGGSGIGRALALALAHREQSVLVIGRRENRLQETAEHSHRIQYLCADVSTMAGLHEIKAYVTGIPPISGLVNNAGTLEPICSLDDMQAKDWQLALNTNLNAAVFLPQLLLKQFRAVDNCSTIPTNTRLPGLSEESVDPSNKPQEIGLGMAGQQAPGNARVLNIGSGAAYRPIKGWAAYCCSKAALAMLTRCWQMESNAIDFANVMPGIIDTDMQGIARTGLHMDPEQVRFYKGLKDHHRLLSPETVATFLAWLLLDVDRQHYVAQEWDIYDTSHHPSWLKPSQQVPHWDF